jgi:hypothetical protein
MKSRNAVLMAILVLALACRGEARAPERDDLRSLVDSLQPSVERAVGLKFKAPITVATRNRDQLRTFLLEKVDEELPPARLHGTEYAYRLLGLLPDSLDLEKFLVALLTEQVAGFYDPRTATLYGMEGYDRAKLTLIMAHEMVHALQHQYLPLDSILQPQADDDRQVAAQAILEGQATIASVKALLPEGMTIPPELWSQSRDMLADAQSSMPLFANAPLVIREELLFPYLAGADFMMWWSQSARNDTLPYGPLMPRSSEQILQPERYAAGDEPMALRFVGQDDALFENTLGDLTIRILAAQLAGAPEIATKLTLGWRGDRFRVYDTPSGPALIWVIAWDDETAADRFERGTGAALVAHSRPDYRNDLVRSVVGGVRATRIVIAPVGWMRWLNLPQVAREAGEPRAAGM